MDQLDKKIVELLLSNGRATHEELAQAVHLSRPAIHERIRRLERTGVIHGYAARVDWVQLGYVITAFIALRFSGVKHTAVERAIEQLAVPETFIDEAHGVTGDYCMFLKVRATTTQALQNLLDAVRDVQGVTATKTTIALRAIQTAVDKPDIALATM